MMTILAFLNLLWAVNGVSVFTLHDNGENIIFYEDIKSDSPSI